MKWIEARIVFESPDPQSVSDLISEIFYDFGLQGVIIEAPGMDMEIDWAETDVTFYHHHAVVGYLPKNDQIRNRCKTLEDRLADLKQSPPVTYKILYHDVDEQDWAESWKKYFFTEKITDTIVIKPSWRDYNAKPGEIILEIDPGMAFGTGTHPTTRMCIQLIEKWIKPEDSFLDVGTGSGILMIAAAKLGAAFMMGTDMDEVAVSVAEQNLQKNNIHPDRYTLQTGNLVKQVKGRFNLVTANILSEIVVNLVDDIDPVISEKGIFICSGIIEPKQAMVEKKLTDRGYQIIDVLTETEWVAIAASYQIAPE